jgi:hypothetical protein
MSAATPDDESGAPGRSRRPNAAGNPFAGRPESADDAMRVKTMTAEVRNPPSRITVDQTPTSVTITDDQGRARTFHPDGREESLRVGDVPVPTVARWEAGQLVVVYNVEAGRQLRYTFSRSADPSQLVVDVKFVERGGGDSVRRIYQPASTTDEAPPPSPAAAPAPASKPPSGSAANGGNPAASRPPIAQGPDGDLKGLTTLGVVVEDLSTKPGACAVDRTAIESAVAKSLSDAGLTVRRNSDEDTYVYVAILTTSLPSGLCVSRYDAYVYSNTTATLSYQAAPVLVQVSLLHQGGLAGGSPAAHGGSVAQGVKQYVDQFAARIRAANKP